MYWANIATDRHILVPDRSVISGRGGEGVQRGDRGVFRNCDEVDAAASAGIAHTCTISGISCVGVAAAPDAAAAAAAAAAPSFVVPHSHIC